MCEAPRPYSSPNPCIRQQSTLRAPRVLTELQLTQQMGFRHQSGPYSPAHGCDSNQPPLYGWSSLASRWVHELASVYLVSFTKADSVRASQMSHLVKILGRCSSSPQSEPQRWLPKSEPACRDPLVPKMCAPSGNLQASRLDSHALLTHLLLHRLHRQASLL